MCISRWFWHAMVHVQHKPQMKSMKIGFISIDMPKPWRIFARVMPTHANEAQPPVKRSATQTAQQYEHWKGPLFSSLSAVLNCVVTMPYQQKNVSKQFRQSSLQLQRPVLKSCGWRRHGRVR